MNALLWSTKKGAKTEARGIPDSLIVSLQFQARHKQGLQQGIRFRTADSLQHPLLSSLRHHGLHTSVTENNLHRSKIADGCCVTSSTRLSSAAVCSHMLTPLQLTTEVYRNVRSSCRSISCILCLLAMKATSKLLECCHQLPLSTLPQAGQCARFSHMLNSMFSSKNGSIVASFRKQSRGY